MRTFSVIITLLVISCAIVMFSFRAEDRTFERQYLQITRDVHSFLVKSGVCLSVPNCRKKKLFYWDPTSKGADFFLYSVKDNLVLAGVTDVIMSHFLEEPDMQRVIFYAYSSNHADQIKKKILETEFRR